MLHYHNVDAPSWFLVSICCLEVILIDGGVDVALTGEKIKGVVHLVLRHVLLDTAEDRIPIYARLVRALLDEAVHQVVVLVSEALVGGGGDVARGSSTLDPQTAAHHGLGEASVTTHNLPVDLLLELPELEMAVHDLQEVGVILRLALDLADLEGHDVLLVLV